VSDSIEDDADSSDINDARLVERKTVLLHVMHGLLVKFRVSALPDTVTSR
jgi:hypothetical protein